MIITDISLLRRPCESVKNLAEGQKIAAKLLHVLDKHNNSVLRRYRKSPAGTPIEPQGVGLSAPQIGILKRVCVLRVAQHPIVLINPVVKDASPELITFTEGCLSLPDVVVDTYRHLWVDVETLNFGKMTFGPKDGVPWTPTNLLLSVVAQHECAHLAKMLPIDFTTKDHPHPLTWGTKS